MCRNGQVRLLQFLKDGSIRSSSGGTIFRVSVRILATTTDGLEAVVEQGTFDEQLALRLAVTRIQIPPLRDRPDDILPLAYHELHRLALEGRRLLTITAEACAAFQAYDWPGNVKELQDSIQGVVENGEDDKITLASLPQRIADAAPPEATPADSVAEGKAQAEELRGHSLRAFLEEKDQELSDLIAEPKAGSEAAAVDAEVPQAAPDEGGPEAAPEAETKPLGRPSAMAVQETPPVIIPPGARHRRVG